MSLRLFVVTGEPSGDFLGARLIAALREQVGDIELEGVGGPQLSEQGLKSIFPMDELSLMGFVEVVPKIPKLLGRLREAADAARRYRPDVLITVDSPSFTLRLLGMLKDLDTARVHYVAPQAWGWRPGRAKKMPALADRYLCILPFEPAFFEPYGVDTRFVGHPIVETMKGQMRARSALPSPSGGRLCLLPGSRVSELTRHLPVLRGAVERLLAERPGLTCVLPTLPRRNTLVRELGANWPAPLDVVETDDARFEAYADADLALASSGTVGLELAMAQVPTVVYYRTSWINAAIARRLARVRFASLINLIANREVVPERIQEACTADRLAADARHLLADQDARTAQRVALGEVSRQLGGDGMPPSRRAADAILEVLGRRAKPGEGRSA